MNDLKLIQRVTRTLYVKDRLEGLINDFCIITTTLETTFPVNELRSDSEATMEKLREDEVHKLEADSRSLVVSRKTPEEPRLDPVVESVLTHISTDNNFYFANSTFTGGRIRNGNFGTTPTVASRNNRYIGNKTLGQGNKLQNGDSFGGKGFWNN